MGRSLTSVHPSSITAEAKPKFSDLSAHQQFWRLRRRRRLQRLPQQMALSMGLFFCLTFVAEQGFFSGWTFSSDPASAIADLGWGQGVTGAVGSVSEPFLGRQLSAMTNTTVLLQLMDTQCPVTNSSSTFPVLDFEDSKAAATTFMVIITLYMFLGLAIVCDSFFEASLSAICEAMNLKDDVAGATWMAAGGSAPELATSIIGVFISRSDVGFGTIVGSAVFNVLFVIACCAFVAPNLQLTWWPLARDAAYYCFSLAMIVIFVTDLQVTWYEAAILLLMYGGYVTIMYYNERLEGWVTEQVAKDEKGGPIRNMLKKLWESPIVAGLLYVSIITNAVMVILEVVEFNRRALPLPCVCGLQVGAAQLPPTAYYYVNLGFNIFFICELVFKMIGYGFFGYWKIPLNCFDGALVFLIVVEFILTAAAQSEVVDGCDPLVDPTCMVDANDAIGVGVGRSLRVLKLIRFVRSLRVLRLGRLARAGADAMKVQPEGETNAAAGDAELGAKVAGEPNGKAEGEPSKDPDAPAKDGEKTEDGDDEEDDDDDDGPFNPFEIWGDFSSPGGIFGRVMWFIGLPLSLAFWLTIPDCRRPMFGKFWFFTFSNCIIWIATLSFFMVWMVERLGVIYNVPESIMGLFVLAAGTSIPDCLSSVAVARRGHGDMAVSSSIGSNIFDVLIGLPIPWFLYTGILRPAIGESYGPQNVLIQSEALAFMILLLFVMVALVITTVHLSGWILSTRLGMAMMGLYFLFLVLALLLDRKVIFPDCDLTPAQVTALATVGR